MKGGKDVPRNDVLLDAVQIVGSNTPCQLVALIADCLATNAAAVSYQLVINVVYIFSYLSDVHDYHVLSEAT